MRPHAPVTVTRVTMPASVERPGVVPRPLRAGWDYGTERWDDGIFLRTTIDSAGYR
jgi:hypothetical protein